MRRLDEELSLEKAVLDAIEEESQRELSSWEGEDIDIEASIQEKLCECRKCAEMLKKARANLELLEETDAPSYYIRVAKAMLKQIRERFL